MKIKVRRLRIQTILLIVNLIVLILPVGGAYFLNLLEDQQIRQTEVDLVAQGATIAAVYAQNILKSGHYKNQNVLDKGFSINTDIKTLPSLTPIKLEVFKGYNLKVHLKPGQTTESADSVLLAIGNQISPILINTQITTLASMRILDYNGIVVASSAGEIGMSYKKFSEVQRSLRGESVNSLRQNLSENQIFSFFSNGRQTGLRMYVSLPVIVKNHVIGVVLLSRTPTSVKRMIFEKKERVIVVLVALLTIVILLTFLTSFTITRPLKELIKLTEQVTVGKTYQKPNLDRPGVKEIQLLAGAFTEMTERMQHRSDYIHNFAMHVSHEFKSPLTSTQGAIELLQNYYEDMSVKKRNQFFNNIAQDTDRLQRLVTRLLELARADVFEPGEEKTEMVNLLEKTQKKYEKSGLAIHLKNIVTSFYLPISKEVLETIISNLFENSLQHGANQIVIELTEKRGSVFRCYDNGKGISAANAGKIFTPFFTTNRKKGGTGLGLQIIQSLLKAHHGSIRHVPTSKGALFEIRFSSFIKN